MDVVYVLVGAALSGWALVEMLTTIMHPDWRAPVTSRLERVVWALARTLRRVAGEKALLLGGPLTVISAVGLWITTLWFGFALIWLGLASSISITAEGAFDSGLSLADVLYSVGHR